uniref:Uncharacterized protein n=1 Tax=uncultured bacterium esnapd26 TaxID=1366607 RepID=S5TVB8_9BACT|nr:hypothetical protein [uncultured bacterium esnapd26]
MFEALLAEDRDRIRLYLAHHEGDLVEGIRRLHVPSRLRQPVGDGTRRARREVGWKQQPV